MKPGIRLYTLTAQAAGTTHIILAMHFVNADKAMRAPERWYIYNSAHDKRLYIKLIVCVISNNTTIWVFGHKSEATKAKKSHVLEQGVTTGWAKSELLP
jgi:hypothetical protein